MPPRSDNAAPGFYEFFAGAGLARLGLGDAWRCLWANDIDRGKAAVYRANFGDKHLHVGDVAQVDAAALPSSAAMAWASFPCQDLSLAGWRRGMSASRSSAFWSFWNVLRDLHQQGRRAPLVVIENVVGLLHGEDFGGLCDALAMLDLQVGALVMDARHFLPQSRPRVFVIACDARLQTPEFWSDGIEGNPWVSPALVAAYDGLPAALKNRWRWWRLPAASGTAVPIEALISDADARWDSAAATGRLLSMMSPRNLAKVRAAQAADRRRVGFLYRRTRDGRQRAEVRFDGLAGCLRTPSGGSSRQTVVVVEGSEVRTRLLTPREAARLMGAPDRFVLPRSRSEAYRAMGDGVAVPVVEWLSQQLLLPLARASGDLMVPEEPRGQALGTLARPAGSL